MVFIFLFDYGERLGSIKQNHNLKVELFHGTETFSEEIVDITYPVCSSFTIYLLNRGEFDYIEEVVNQSFPYD